MTRKLATALVLLIVAMMLIPQGITSAQARTVRIPVWHGVEGGARQYSASASTTVVLAYIWVARTAQQVEDFMTHADITVTINGEPVFTPQPGKDQGWQSVEVSQLNDLARAQWTFPLPALEAGTYEIRTVITLDAEVSDGLEPAPFSGTVNDTTNVLVVTGGATAAGATAGAAAAVAGDEVNCNAAVGTFVKAAVGYWAPDFEKPIEPELIIPEGKTLWTFGLDETHQFYQVLLDMQLFWVEANTLAPTPDEVWNNTPLPNCVVE